MPVATARAAASCSLHISACDTVEVTTDDPTAAKLVWCALTAAAAPAGDGAATAPAGPAGTLADDLDDDRSLDFLDLIEHDISRMIQAHIFQQASHSG